MTFSFECRHCKHRNVADWSQVGQSTFCQVCQAPTMVPAPLSTEDQGEQTRPLPGLNDLLKFSCQECGRRYSARAELMGKRIRCGGCNSSIKIPAIGSILSSGGVLELGTTPPSNRTLSSAELKTTRSSEHQHQLKRSRPAETSLENGSTDLDELSVGFLLPTYASKLDETRRPIPQKEPSDVEVGCVLPSRSEKMVEVEAEMSRKAEAKQKQRLEREKKARPAFRKRQVGGGFDMEDVGTILGASTATVLVVGLLTYSFPEIRGVIGGGLAALGMIVYLIGSAGFSKVAREEGAHVSLMCRFVPFYKWYFLQSRWQELKGAFALLSAGMILFWPGMWILQISPEALKAKLAEEAYNVKQSQREAQNAPPAVFADPE